MARQVVVRLSCDVCESVADVRSLEFAVEPAVYEIDLCATHHAAFTESLAAFVAPARRARPLVSTPTATTVPSNRAATRRDPAQTEAIRTWAKHHGHAISTRGRIPAAIEAAYNSHR